MNFNHIIEVASIVILPAILAITLHEAAHGWVADKLGDPTARVLGRITANPLKHIDPIGTILVPLILVMTIGVAFGWAKPVPVDVRNFKRQVKYMAIVAAAGPISNFLMAICWAIIAYFAVNWLDPDIWFKSPLALMAAFGVFINVVLMTLNLLPLLPLDGGRVLAGFLSPQAAAKFMKIEPYGLIILLVLLFSNILGKILIPVVLVISAILFSIFGLDNLLPALLQFLNN